MLSYAMGTTEINNQSHKIYSLMVGGKHIYNYSWNDSYKQNVIV